MIYSLTYIKKTQYNTNVLILKFVQFRNML